MKINYILSETTAGATSAAIQQLVKEAEVDVFSNIVVLVPEQKSIAIEREILDVSKAGAVANVFIYSFVRLLNRVGKIEEFETVSKQACVMILKKVIMDNFEKLNCYKKTAKSVGFAEKIYETISQIKSSGLTVDDVKKLAEKSVGALKSKMEDIYVLFEAYQNVLHGDILDDSDRLKKLGELAKTSDFIKNSKIFIVGFDDVTNEMTSIFKELATHSKEITFSCCYFNENRKDKYIQNNELFNKLKIVAEELKYPYIPKFVRTNLKGDFWNMQNSLFVPGQKQLNSNGNIELFEFENKDNEIEFVADKIIEEIKAGKRFRDIAVVDLEFENDIEKFERVFQKYQIPYFFSKSYDVSNHFFVQFIKDSIEMVLSHFSDEKVLKWLSNPIMNTENYSKFENYVKEFGISYSGFFDKDNVEKIENEEIKIVINNFLDLICDFRDNFSGVFSGICEVQKYVSGIEKIIERYSVVDRLNEISNFEKDNDLIVESEITANIFKNYEKINKNIQKYLNNCIFSANEFIQIYLSGFAECEMNLVPVSVDVVLVQKNIDGIYNVKDLFVVGSVDGKFPCRMQDTGILVDSELDKTAEVLEKGIGPTINSINKRENYLAFEMLLLPKEKLYMSYALRSGGGINKPARVFEKIAKLFNFSAKKYNKLCNFITKQIAEVKFAKQIGEYFTSENVNNFEINSNFNKLKNSLSENFKKYILNLCFGEKEFVIEKASEIYFLNSKTSVSQLERYFSCPYKFFADYGLRLKENKDATLTSLDVGTIIHRFAEIFTGNIEKYSLLNQEELDKKSSEILNSAFDELKVNKNKNMAILKFIEDEAKRLGRYLFFEQQNSNFKNDKKLNEFEFRGNNAVKLNLGDDKFIFIEGKIDRIDKFGDYIRIIDYKTGEIENNLNSIYYGKKIQLVSYLSATEKFIDKKVAGLFYFPIHSDFVKISQKEKNKYKMKGYLLNDVDVVKNMDVRLSLDNNESDFVPLKLKNNKDVRETGELQIFGSSSKNYFTSKEFDDVKNYTNKLCSGAVNEILSGYIEPAPLAKPNERESSECQYCVYAGFCDRGHAKFGLARRCGADVSNVSFNLTEGDNNGN